MNDRQLQPIRISRSNGGSLANLSDLMELRKLGYDVERHTKGNGTVWSVKVAVK